MPATETVAAIEALQRAADLLSEALEREPGDRGLYRLTRAAEYLDTPVATVRSWIRAGRLTATRVGHNTYVARSDLEAFIRAHRVAGGGDS